VNNTTDSSNDRSGSSDTVAVSEPKKLSSKSITDVEMEKPIHDNSNDQQKHEIIIAAGDGSLDPQGSSSEENNVEYSTAQPPFVDNAGSTAEKIVGIDTSSFSTIETLPSVLSFNSLVLQQIVKREILIPKSNQCQIIFVYSSNDTNEKRYTAMFKSIANNILSSSPDSSTTMMECVFIAADSLDDHRIVQYFNQVETPYVPVMFILLFDDIGYERERRYSIGPIQKMYPSDVEKMIKEILNATTTVQPYWESEPIQMWSSLKSEELNANHNHLVGHQFKSHVIDSTGIDVLVLVYAKWCQHCK
jgi:hypothetical protein